ncbi:transcriptional regulator [Rhizobium laguerreae]|uniref:type IV toxin-antitoxin system AbiEi family antitoxin domain-containing protein n=1 Tax=Rhizobium laguerreae TaxID=1076926 RepID=UPI001441D917|nr:type IV toxin-antitoxin system AbiEi family antitoxin domain-containing protein [Rhizobium laguerreae]MBY3475302.1 transcriptional regulator [Rhizobium laguerreae]MBY3574349.1 transcriptional regulator [Rhizobium laguerreae]NKN08583.1 transcriptional regulator [Rhizobium laguerreae]
MPSSVTQRQIARTVLTERGIARFVELRNAGVTAATMSRMERDGEVLRLARGLYQLPDAQLDASHSLAEVAKRAPKAVICLVSALAFHSLTDQLPGQIWLAIGRKDWPPKLEAPAVRIVRFTDSLLNDSVETHIIEGVPVRVFGIAKTIADCFRYRNKIGLSVAIEGLQEALRQRRATPGEIGNQAERGGVGSVIRPYLEALTANG